jgi:hypothetical protein
MEIINTETVIYRSLKGSRNHRFSCFKKDLDGNVILENGLPAKYHFVMTNKELRVSDPLKVKSIDDWIKYHTKVSVKDGKEIKTCEVQVGKFTEAEMLKLLEPEAIVMKNEKGEDIKVSVEELKKSYVEWNANKPPEDKASTPVHGTRTSKNNPK